MANSIDRDEIIEPSHQDLHCLQKHDFDLQGWKWSGGGGWGDTFGRVSAIFFFFFYSGDNVCGLLFTFLYNNKSFWKGVFVCLCWGFTAQSTQWGHVERGQFT